MRYVILTVLILLLASPARPDDDHEHARAAFERGDVQPLGRIMEIAERAVGGRVIGVEFERDHGRYVYELELVTDDGRLIELAVDAASGRILEHEYEDD